METLKYKLNEKYTLNIYPNGSGSYIGDNTRDNKAVSPIEAAMPNGSLLNDKMKMLVKKHTPEFLPGITSEVTKAIRYMLSDAAEAYASFCLDCVDIEGGELAESSESYHDQFTESLKLVAGKKYIKIQNEHGSPWCFIVNVRDDEVFEYGDILAVKSASSPKRDFERGNIFGEYEVTWQGPQYVQKTN